MMRDSKAEHNKYYIKISLLFIIISCVTSQSIFDRLVDTQHYKTYWRWCPNLNSNSYCL